MIARARPFAESTCPKQQKTTTTTKYQLMFLLDVVLVIPEVPGRP